MATIAGKFGEGKHLHWGENRWKSKLAKFSNGGKKRYPRLGREGFKGKNLEGYFSAGERKTNSRSKDNCEGEVKGRRKKRGRVAWYDLTREKPA